MVQSPPGGTDLVALEARLNTRRVRLRAVWLGVPFFLWLVRPTPASLVVGAAVAVVGLTVRGWAAGTIHKEAVLTTTGPYAHTRNPLYLGSLLVGVGITWASGYPAWTAAFLAFYLLVYSRTMAGERVLLTAKFGEAYQAYAAAVPGFLPRLTPWRPDAAPGAPEAGPRPGAVLDGPQASAAAGRPRVPKGFTWARYRRNKEWEAALGTVLVLGYMTVRMALG